MSNSKKLLLSIAGLTATGKTSLALKLAEEVIDSKKYKGVILISADSKQIYQGLEILTGADIPPNFTRVKHQPYDYFQHKALPIQIHGVSIINPDDEWSVTHFRDLAIQQINQSWNRRQLIIVVGGAGFYHQQLLSTNESIYVKPNKILRKRAEKMNVKELQKWLKRINPERFSSMNSSDKNNPRRLTRAIELEHCSSKHNLKPKRIKNINDIQVFSIGTYMNQRELENKIRKRIKKRIRHGAVGEVEKMLNLSLSPSEPAMTTAGVQPLSDFLKKKITLNEAVSRWQIQELQYSKKQLTWFRKYRPELWLNVSQESAFETTKKKLLASLEK